MAIDTEIALTNLGNELVTGLIVAQHAQNRVATGGTINQIDVVVTPTRMYIEGPAYLVALEVGRKPTSATGPYMKTATGMSFKDTLALWMEARGIDQGKMPKNGGYGPVLWAIYTKINQKGYKGTPGVLSKPLSDQAIDAAMNNALGPLADLYAQQVLKTIFG